MSEEKDALTAELVRLAQRELNGDSPLSDEAGFARMEARISQPGRAWSNRALVGGAALVAVGAVAAVLVFVSRSRPLTFDVAGSTLGESGRIVAAASTHVHFSDGSEADLASGTEARIQNLTSHGAEVVLTRGSMRLHVTHKPQASWKVAAGPYEVRVTGTAFGVSWSNETFDLRLETGSVIVTGPLAPSIPLKAGQHLFGGAAIGRLVIENGGTTSSPLLAPEMAAAAPSAAAPDAPPEAQTEEAREPPGSMQPPSASPLAPHSSGEARVWARQVAEGHFDTVLEQADRRGLDRTLSTGSLEELSALADAARYAGRSPLAKRVLLAERQRFPASSAALDAAFFLGRIAEDSGSGGIDWYERYLSESPRGTYASQAAGRKMMLLYKQRGAAAASAAAADYMARYPKGPYAAAARKLAEESQSQHSP